MKIRCEYCGSNFEDTLDHCPNCGAASRVKKMSEGQPKTIEELKKWYDDRHLPPAEITRFFIGVNYTKPKAFGIYKDESGNFIVYKNKADGTRAVRYEGTDEEYAVQELWQKLKDEIVHQKNNKSGSVSSKAKSSQRAKIILSLFAGYMALVLITPVLWRIESKFESRFKKVGYYSYPGYESTYEYRYYHDSSDHWYYYDISLNVWYSSSEPSWYNSLTSVENDPYYVGYTTGEASTEWGEFTAVQDSDVWDDTHPSRSTSSDYDWDSGSSWDSGGTDWDSDW